MSLSEPPHISLYESRVLVASGDEATLFCAADGIPKPKIRWYRGEVEVNKSFFNSFHSNVFSHAFDRICMELSILYFKGSQVEISKL